MGTGVIDRSAQWIDSIEPIAVVNRRRSPSRGRPDASTAFYDAGSPSATAARTTPSRWEGPFLDVHDNADFLGAAALGDEGIVLFAVDDEPVLRRISASA